MLIKAGVSNPQREDYAEYSFSTVMDVKNATQITKWGVTYELQEPYDGKKHLMEQIC